MNNVMKKIMSLTLGVAILCGSLGVAATTEASPRHHGAHMEAGAPPPPEHREHREHRDEHQEPEKEGHSTGEVTTAAIVGAVVGAVIANNT